MRRSRQRSVLTLFSVDGVRCRAAAKEDLDIRIPDNDDSLNTFVVNLNVSLDRLDLEIVPFVDGLTGNQVYILVRLCGHASFLCCGTDVFTTQANRKGDEIAQVASDYSPAELAYFKVLVRLCCYPLDPPLICLR